MLPNRRRNKMKNYEKYAEEIKGYKGINICSEFIKSHILEADNCNGIDCQRCAMLQMLWLFEDYEEPEEPEVDWSKVEVDTPILVRQTKDGEWLRRHFAKYENGIVYTWKDGHTSWTVLHDEDVTAWKFAKLAESEEE